MTTPLDKRYHPPLPSDPHLRPRTGAWQFLLSVLFLGLFWFWFPLSVPELPFEAPAEELLIPLFMLLIPLGLVGFAVLVVNDVRKKGPYEWGWELLQAGETAAALRYFETAVREARRPFRYSRACYGLALARLRRGDFEQALSLGHASARYGNHRSAISNTKAPALVSTVQALRGNLEAALAWGVVIQPPRFDRTDYALLPHVVMLCRTGQYADAVKRIQATQATSLPEEHVRVVQVLHAFARARPEARALPLAPGCALPVKPTRPDTYAYLAREWPELAAFLRGEEATPEARGA